MKKKSLLLLIPFAAAALAGCTPAAPACEQAVITIPEGKSSTINVEVDGKVTIPYQIQGGSCSGELPFKVEDQTVAKVVFEDNVYKVEGLKEGITKITCNGTSWTVYVGGESPDPQKEVVSIKSASAVVPSIKVGGTYSASNVKLTVVFSDESEGEVRATRVEVDTSKVAASVTGQAWYNDIGPAEFTIAVTEEDVAVYGTEDNPISVSQALATMGIDCKEDNTLTKQPMYCVGEIKEVKAQGVYEDDDYWYELICTDGEKDVEVYRIHVDAQLLDQIEVGETIKWKGYGKNFKGTLEFVDNGATKCVLLDNTIERTVTKVVSVESAPPSVVVGGTVSPLNVKLNVEYNNGDKGVVESTRVEVDTSVEAKGVKGKAWYNSLGPVEFTIDVVGKLEPQHEGTEQDPYTPSDAAIVANGLEQTTDSKNPIATDKQYYIKGTVSKLAKAFDAKYGSYSFWLGNDEFEVWQIYNGSSKAKFNEGDIEPGDQVTIKAKIMNFKGTPENTTDSYVVSVIKGGDPETPTINLSSYSATIKLNESTTVTAAVTNSEEAVSWSIVSGDDKVEITPNDKTVTITGVAAGSAVVRATLGTTGLYKECNVTVKGEAPVVEGTILDFAELNTTSGEQDSVSYTSAKGAGQSDPAYNESNKELRLYAKNTIKIEATGITKITFDYNGCYSDGDKDPCNKATGDIASASVGTISAGVWTGSADEVTFTMSDAGQVHIHKIGVIHEEAEERILSSITVSNEHRTFEVGDEFVPETVTAHYENADDSTVTSKATFEDYDMSTSGQQTVKVSYTENSVTKTTTYDITVNVPAEKDIYNFTAASQTAYTDDDHSGATATITGATGYEPDRGVAWNKSAGTVTISGLKAGTIKKITLDVSHNKTTNPTVSVSVGGNEFGNVFTIDKVNHVSAEFLGSAESGDVVVSVSKTTDGSIWVKKITVEFEAGEPPVVDPAVKSVTVSPKTLKLDLTETTTSDLTAVVDAVGGAEDTVTWSSSNLEVATVDESGKVTAVSAGEATITATSTFDDTKFDTCEVEVLSAPAPEPVLTEIYIDGDMTNKTYSLGDSWSAAGLQVKAKWTEGKEDTLLDASEYDLAFDPTTPVAETTQVVVTATLKADGTKIANKTVTGITVNEKANSVKTAYDAAMALEDGGVTTSEYTFEGVVTATQGSSFVVYDRDYAILVYNKSVSGLAVGKTVKVVSTMQNYGGLAETKTISSATLTGTGTVPEAVSITSVAQLSEYKTNILVDCAQIEVVSKQSGWSSSNSNNWSVKINGESVTLSLSKYTYDATKAEVLSALDVGDKFTARNLIIGSFKGTRQLSSTGESTFSKFVPEVTAVSVTGDFTKKSYNLGNDWDISGLVFKGTTADGEITLNSSDFDFTFSPENATDTSITSVVVTATYKAKPELTCSKTITGITVNDAPAVEPYDVTFVKNTSASSYTGTYNQTLDDIEWVLNGNGSIDNYVKLSSGTANSTADRYICSQTAFDNEASQIIFKTGALDSAATVNSVTLTVHSSAEDAKSGSNATESVSGTWVTNGEMSFSKPTGSNWSGKYFRLTLNLSNTTKNKGVIITGVKVMF